MRVVLATGIYPPEIGGPATYVRELAAALRAKGVHVTIVAYGRAAPDDARDGVIRVARDGGPLRRYVRYAKALRAAAGDADIVEAFSSVSVGVPLWLAHLRGPKKVLRLGGDFLWERATDRGESRGLREWYDAKPAFTGFMNGLLRTFDVIAFSTEFQEELYRRYYRNLPRAVVIENVSPSGRPDLHRVHDPLRVLFLGRFVAFKNLPSLVSAVAAIRDARLTLAGSGPEEETLRALVEKEAVGDRVTFAGPVHGDEKAALFRDNDVLVIPSKTEISPNTALEARAAGLPVLLTRETGLSKDLLDGMTMASLATTDEIVRALAEFRERYDAHAARAAQPLKERTWHTVADEHLALFSSLL